MTTKVSQEVPTADKQAPSAQQTKSRDQPESGSKEPAADAEPPVYQLTSNLTPDQLRANLQNIVPVMSFLVSIVVILFMAHEYRYNTIMYTLTQSNSRNKVIAAKIITAVIYSLFMAGLVILASTLSTHLAADLKSLNLPYQDIDWLLTTGRLAAYITAYSLFGLAFVTLIRNTAAGIVSIFILPIIESMVEGLLSGHNIATSYFLPFAALNRIVNVASDGSSSGAAGLVQASVGRSLIVVATYLVVIWVVSWYLFLRRDAN